MRTQSSNHFVDFPRAGRSLRFPSSASRLALGRLPLFQDVLCR
jgi:hypothetical protein